MIAAIERLTGLERKNQGTVFLVGFGHGGTHWIIGSIYVLLPFIQRDLGLSYTSLGVLFMIFHFSAFAANFGSGLLVDVTGRRVVLMVASLCIGAAAFLAFGWAKGITYLSLMMVLVGGTNNLWHPPAISYLSGLFPKSRGYALSIHAFGASFGDIAAPLAVGAMLVWSSWQTTAIFSALPVFLIAGLIGVLLLSRDFITGDLNNETGEQKRGLSFQEYLDGMLAMVRDRGVLGLAMMAGVRSMAQSGLLLFIPLYLANVLKVGPTIVGVGIAAMQLGGMIAAPLAGTWSDRIGRRPVVLAGLSGSTVMIAALTLAGNEALFIAGISVLGFLLFAVRPVIHSWMMDLTPPNMAGSATSVMFGAQSLLSMAAPLAGGMIADAWGLPAVFYALAAVMLVANVLVYLLPHHDPGHDAGESKSL
ncbi:MAG: MFS transporter [Proteobacteria bacterium]|nr:MFS transporter [Pseudomonadota bacterium]MDA1023284.1 MFS transporter [Pseudomonadota bacterium]